MKWKCWGCGQETWFIKVICWDTDKIPHEQTRYKCEKCGHINGLSEIKEASEENA